MKNPKLKMMLGDLLILWNSKNALMNTKKKN